MQQVRLPEALRRHRQDRTVPKLQKRILERVDGRPKTDMVEGMITRAQAEALLTLAESLEACERLSIELCVPGRDEMVLLLSDEPENLDLERGGLTSMSIRLAVNALIPKSETWVVAQTMTLSCPAWDEDIVVIKPRQET